MVQHEKFKFSRFPIFALTLTLRCRCRRLAVVRRGTGISTIQATAVAGCVCVVDYLDELRCGFSHARKRTLHVSFDGCSRCFQCVASRFCDASSVQESSPKSIHGERFHRCNFISHGLCCFPLFHCCVLSPHHPPMACCVLSLPSPSVIVSLGVTLNLFNLYM